MRVQFLRNVYTLNKTLFEMITNLQEARQSIFTFPAFLNVRIKFKFSFPAKLMPAV